MHRICFWVQGQEPLCPTPVALILPPPPWFHHHMLKSSLISGHCYLPGGLSVLYRQSLPRAHKVPGASQERKRVCEGICF